MKNSGTFQCDYSTLCICLPGLLSLTIKCRVSVFFVSYEALLEKETLFCCVDGDEHMSELMSSDSDTQIWTAQLRLSESLKTCFDKIRLVTALSSASQSQQGSRFCRE